MEKYGNNDFFKCWQKQIGAVDGEQEIYLEWPYSLNIKFHDNHGSDVLL